MDVFRTLQQTCTADFAEGGSFETVAQAIHTRYGDIQAGKTTPPAWSKLSESFKASNRNQARHIAVKMNEIGCQIVPLRDWGAIDFTFTDEEVEKLADIEHTRWWDERRADGWSLGEEKDEKLKNPYMVAWKELPPDIAPRRCVRSRPRGPAVPGAGCYSRSSFSQFLPSVYRAAMSAVSGPAACVCGE